MKSLQPRLGALLLSALALSLLLSGCELAAVGESEEIANVQTVLAGTPSATTSPTITTTPEPTLTHTPTVGPSPTASHTPEPTLTPLPPTPTPNPALTGFSYCDQQVGAVDSRFSARLAEVRASGTPAYEQVVIRFELADGSAAIGASASCISAATLTGEPVADSSSPYALRVELPGWLRDERFSASTLTETLSFEGTRTLTAARLVPGDTPEAGATLLIDLAEPLPFRLSIERNPTRLTLAVARNTPLVSSSDSLRVPSTTGPELAEALFVIVDGEIWQVAAGNDAGPGLAAASAGATNLSNSPETETALAVSPDGQSIAFCRAAPGLDPADAELPVPSALWIMDADGANQRPLAQVGVSCADPAFSPDGAAVAFAVDETGATPVQRTIYRVPTAGGQPERLLEGVDEWSRFAPQWLADEALVFAAAAQDGRSTLFLRRADGEVTDLGADLLLRDSGGAPYEAVGRPLAAPDGARFAVELVRGANQGAALAILDAQGAVLELIGAQRTLPPATPTPTTTPTAAPSATRTARPSATSSTPQPSATATEAPAETGTPTLTPTLAPTAEAEAPALPVREGPFWTRPLAWDDDGRLLLLTTLCASEVVQDYQVTRWNGAGRSELLAAGQGLGGIGAASASGDTLAYVLTEQASAGPRGPAASTPRSPAALWLWNLADGTRGALVTAERDFAALGR